MLPTSLHNWLVPSKPPTTSAQSLIPEFSSPQSHPGKIDLLRKQGGPTYRFVTLDASIKVLTATVLVGLILVLLYRLIIMKRISLDESHLQKPVEETNRAKHSRKCVVPGIPEHGIFIIPNAPDAKPGDSFESLELSVACLPDYGVLGTEKVFCVNGFWSHSTPECIRFCKLDKNPSVNYHCLVTGSFEGSRPCNAYEPSGTVVKPECDSPNYSVVSLPYMRCINGSWDYVATCSSATECGRVTTDGAALMTRDGPAMPNELPWHVGIYRKTNYMQICGGSLVSKGVVISAAVCFWNNVIKQLPASRFAVAAGKIHRFWNNRIDVHAQKSDVKEINIPARFQGSITNFQDDIAVVILETPFEYTQFVRPVCLNFDINFETRQLQPENKGMVAGWRSTVEHGKASQTLKVAELSYVGVKQCIEEMTRDFREYLTSDKICASNENGTALCKGDSGGGLVFPDSDRYYLRGIVSISPKNDNSCNTYSLTTFTQILAHKHFLMQFL